MIDVQIADILLSNMARRNACDRPLRRAAPFVIYAVHAGWEATELAKLEDIIVVESKAHLAEQLAGEGRLQLLAPLASGIDLPTAQELCRQRADETILFLEVTPAG